MYGDERSAQPQSKLNFAIYHFIELDNGYIRPHQSIFQLKKKPIILFSACQQSETTTT
jgi:hypothetical protein